ncbi:MAG: penicillin-binding protein [Chloroflexota bacterium]
MNSTKKMIVARKRRRRNRITVWHVVGRLLVGLLVVALALAGVAVLSGALTTFGVYAYFAQDLPSADEIEVVEEHFETTKLYDRTGQTLIYEIVNPLGDRTYVHLDQIPEHFRNAVIALEDKNFYSNPGFDPQGIFKAFLDNLTGGDIRGGSSITQQLVKNVLIAPEERFQKSYTRKIKEVILAVEITRRFEKDQILQWYLNTNFYGNLATGVEAAAQVYFGKHIWELDLAECSMLALIPQSPAYNPIDNWEEAKERQAITLNRMVEESYITPQEAEAAYRQDLQIRERGVLERYEVKVPHFALFVEKQLVQKFGEDLVYRGGLKVYTTVDLDLQARAEEIARAHIATLEAEEKDVSNAAVVVMDPRTAEILVMMGSLDYWDETIDGEVNNALAENQPGSSFKPFTYLTAFSQGYSPADMVMDVRTTFLEPLYTPENYDRKYHGPQTLRTALARSYNIPAVKVLDWVGVDNVIKTAHRLGIDTLNRDLDYYGLSLTLGGGEVTLLDMTYAFGVFANGGRMAGMSRQEQQLRSGYRELEPVPFLRIEDRNGSVVWEYTAPATQQVVDSKLNYLLVDVLADRQARLAAFGYNNALELPDNRPAAAKTGTTNNYWDAWTIGFTPQLVTGVWVGNADNTPMNRLPGSRGAAPIWNQVMTVALEGEPIVDFVRPPGIKEVVVCSVSGKLPTQHCPNTITELFIEGNEPTTYCDVHQAFRVNRETGKLATVYTPPELVDEIVYNIYPADAADWVRENDIPQPPTQYDTYGPDPTSGPVVIVDPPPYAYVKGILPVIGNARAGNFAFYRLEYGPGLNPDSWSLIGGDHYNQVDNAPLEFWDVRGLDGLYTLRLTVVENNQQIYEYATQVTVDNAPPQVTVSYPEEGQFYVMEDDEWLSIQADAVDNFSMSRVDFYLDNQLLGTSTVPPYNKRWTITMSDTRPSLPIGTVITATEVITQPDGSLATQVITLTQVISQVIDQETDVVLTAQYFHDGFGLLIDSAGGYTETHLIHVMAFDAAGNEVESLPVRVYVTHKKEKEEEQKQGANLQRDDWLALLPDNRRWAGG